MTVASNGGTADTSSSGLGATLEMEGQSVSVASRILLPSGALTLYATEGDVNVAGTLDVGGVGKGFYDTTAYTNGGTVTLTADQGNVVIDAGAKVDVAAQSGGGDGGTLAVSAIHGTFSTAGTLLGGGGTDGVGGTFTLDVASLASTAWLDAILNTGGFDTYRKYRVRTGDVAVDGVAQAGTYRVSADEGSIYVTGEVDASGSTGGTIYMAAHGSLVVESGALLTVEAQDFNSAGEGGSITLEAGGSTLDSNGNYTHDTSALLDIQTGSKIILSVDSATSESASLGDFTGILHLRAPQTSDSTDLQMAPINGEIIGASVIIVEGYKVYVPTGGSIDSVEAQVLSDGNLFVGAAGSASSGYEAMFERLLKNNTSLESLVSIRPGAEIVNAGSSASSLLVSLASGGSITVPTETSVTFPSAATISVTAQALITYADGSTATLDSGTTVTIPAGASVSFTSSRGDIQSESGSAISLQLPSSSTNYFTTSSGSTTLKPTASGYSVELGKTSSTVTVEKGAVVTFTNGTPGSDKIKASVSGTITLANGTTQTLKANTATTIAAGSTVVLNSAGTITFASGTDGAICVSLAANHTYTLAGTVYISTSTSDLTLGNIASTSTSDWNLASYRFGVDSVPGVLTLRSTGNVVLYNSISDGFVSSSYSSLLMTANSLLSANAQSWSYRITAGADLTGVDFSDVEDADSLDENSGSVLLGKYGYETVSSGATAQTSKAVTGYYQVIRTGSGDIEIYAGRNVKLRNQFATIYTAGTLISNADSIWSTGDFDVPIQSETNSSYLGNAQQSTAYKAQYSMGGGDVIIFAGQDIKHETLTTSGALSEASENELPINWLDRRGAVDSSTGQFETSHYGEVASTTWWVDFSNFFEGVGALGGGNVTLIAGRNITNVDAVIPTNARMPKGTPDASKLLELGGGDLVVKAGNNISGGVYYVENGDGTLYAGNDILTNATRSPSYTVVTNYASSVDADSVDSWLPTTLFLGKGSFDVSAGGDLLLGPVVNSFLMPEGYNNTYWYKSYFSTYDTSSSVSVTSLTGDVTLRESTTETVDTSDAGGVGTQNILWLYINNVLLFNKSVTTTSYYQPWLRLDESDVSAFATACSVMPGTLNVTSFSGDINVVGTINLSPSPTGTLSLLSAGSVNGLNVAGNVSVNDVTYSLWTASSINLSDADPDSIPGVASPYSYQEYILDIYGTYTSSRAGVSSSDFLSTVFDSYFAENGDTEGANLSLANREKLHDSSVLHSDDDTPVYIYAESGDISGLTLYTGKFAQIMAGNDISDISFYIQNARKGDVSIVSAGRDLLPYDPSSTSRKNVTPQNYSDFVSDSETSLPGDIQISGPGTLEVLAGRDIILGGTASSSLTSLGVGVGITSIGNTRNPYLPYVGADIFVAAGLNGSSISYSGFITKFLNPSTATNASLYLSEAVSYIEAFLSDTDLSNATDEQIWSAFQSLSQAQQQTVATRLFYQVLRNAGRNHNDSSSPDYQYQSAYEAIAALFPGSDWSGKILLPYREIKTTHGSSTTTADGSTLYEGGNISIMVPGGTLEVGSDLSSDDPNYGVITEHGGEISIFANDSVEVGKSRIFTLRGGDIIIWSTAGDIAAGSSSRTVTAASPTRVMIDPQSANVETDLSGLATGGGIGVLATVSGVEAGSVDLIAPTGTVDAGEAGIRATGDLYVAALQVLNAGNIQVGGQSVGTTVAASGPSIGALTSAANTSAAVMNSSDASVAQGSAPSAGMIGEIPSIISVEVLGYGGGDDDDL
ncbi:MAG: filamentous hemagglutinin family protein [Chthoniobacteraceae bacterium]